MRWTIFLALAVLSTPVIAKEQKTYRCKDFVSDMTAFTSDKSITWDEMGTSFSQSVGIVVGVYFAKSGEEYNYESKGYQTFQDSVFADCLKNPSDKVAAIALRTPLRQMSNTEYQAIELTDLRLDFEKLKGKKVEVTGSLQTLGEFSMISSGAFDTNKFFVDTKKLPRESRKYIIENCDGGCEVRIRGRVSEVILNPGIIAAEMSPL